MENLDLQIFSVSIVLIYELISHADDTWLLYDTTDEFLFCGR